MPPESDPETREAEPLSLSEDLRLLIEEGKALGQAEIAWQAARARYAAGQAGGVALLALLAAALMFCALMALIFGTVLALGPMLGPWGAAAAVVGALLIAAALAAALAAARVRRTKRMIADREDRP